MSSSTKGSAGKVKQRAVTFVVCCVVGAALAVACTVYLVREARR